MALKYGTEIYFNGEKKMEIIIAIIGTATTIVTAILKNYFTKRIN